MIDITDGDILLDGRSVKERRPAELRREIGYAIQQIGLFPHLSVATTSPRVPRLLGWDKAAHPRARRRAARAREPRSARDARPLPRPALGRPAPARRRGARARRRPAADADGRALRRDRPDQPRAAPERVPAPAARDPQDGRLRHPRHRRGDQDGRPHRGAAEGRQARPVRPAGGAARCTRRTAFVEDFVGADRALKRLALQRVRDVDLWKAPLVRVGRARRRGARQAERRRRPLSAARRRRRTPARLAVREGARAASASRTSCARTRSRSSTSTTSCATRSPTCSTRRPSTARSSTSAAPSRACSRSRSSSHALRTDPEEVPERS